MRPEIDCEEENSPTDNCESFFAKGHELIDSVFSTDRAKSYSAEEKERHPKPEVLMGEMPNPRSFFGGGKASVRKMYQTSRYGRLPPTQAITTRGWKVGQDITNRTRFGNIPKWDTVRARHWKNQAYYYPEEFDKADLRRLRKGRAPQRFNQKSGKMESKELHHSPGQRDGGLFEFIEVWSSEHAKLDHNRRIGK